MAFLAWIASAGLRNRFSEETYHTASGEACQFRVVSQFEANN
jgi:hypothetical protein